MTTTPEAPLDDQDMTTTPAPAAPPQDAYAQGQDGDGTDGQSHDSDGTDGQGTDSDGTDGAAF